MKVGFIGTGALAAAIVTGLKSSPLAAEIVVSPRNAQNAAALAARFPGVRIGADNQAVLDSCDTVILAVRPPAAREVLAPLRFRADQHVITLLATLSRDEIAALVQPAARVTKALPMPMIAHRLGATLVHPPDREAVALFGAIGEVIEVDDAAEFAALTVATATYAIYFKYLDTIHSWLKTQGVDGEKSRDYLVRLFTALAAAPEKAPDAAFMDLATEYATRGGINEQLLGEFTSRDVFDVLDRGLDAIHERIVSKART